MGLPGGNPVPWEHPRGKTGPPWVGRSHHSDHHYGNSHLNCADVRCRVPEACQAREDGLALPVQL